MKQLVKKSLKQRSGYTLIECLVALGILAMIMLGTMDIFIGSLRMASRTNAEVFASLDSNRAIRHIMDITRESLWFALPDSNDTTDSGGTLYFTDELAAVPGMSSYTTANFLSHDATNTYKADTGMYIAFPATSSGVTVATSTSSSVSLPYSVYNRNSPSSSYLFLYRADPNGAPNALSGTCLWEIGTDGGVSVNKALITSVSTAWNAVQFVRPMWPGTSGPIPYEVEVKVTSSYYSAINGNQTDESTNGNTNTQLIGRCVAIRNHELTGAHLPGYTSSSGTGNRFRAS